MPGIRPLHVKEDKVPDSPGPVYHYPPSSEERLAQLEQDLTRPEILLLLDLINAHARTHGFEDHFPIAESIASKLAYKLVKASHETKARQTETPRHEAAAPTRAADRPQAPAAKASGSLKVVTACCGRFVTAANMFDPQTRTCWPCHLGVGH